MYASRILLVVALAASVSACSSSPSAPEVRADAPAVADSTDTNRGGPVIGGH